MRKGIGQLGRYFIALAKNCSPFRTGWLKLHGWKNKGRQIEGRAKDHRTVPKVTPSFVKEEKDKQTLGDVIISRRTLVPNDLWTLEKR